LFYGTSLWDHINKFTSHMSVHCDSFINIFQSHHHTTLRTSTFSYALVVHFEICFDHEL
jgi:hypothetical protein